MISNVGCLEICAGTLFLMLLKFGAVLSIICGFLMAVLYLGPFTAMYCCRAVVSEDAKITSASGLQTLSLGVLDHELNLHQNIPLRFNFQKMPQQILTKIQFQMSNLKMKMH